MAFQSPFISPGKKNGPKIRRGLGLSPGSLNHEIRSPNQEEMQKENGILEAAHSSFTKRPLALENHDPNLINTDVQRCRTQGAEHMTRTAGVDRQCALQRDNNQSIVSLVKAFSFASPSKHVCKSRRCAANNPDYAMPVPIQPRKFLLSKRHQLQQQDTPVCKCCLERGSAKTTRREKSAKKRQPCTCGVSTQSNLNQRIEYNINDEALDHTENYREDEPGSSFYGKELRYSSIDGDFSLEEKARETHQACKGDIGLQMSSYAPGESKIFSQASLPQPDKHINEHRPPIEADVQLVSLKPGSIFEASPDSQTSHDRFCDFQSQYDKPRQDFVRGNPFLSTAAFSGVLGEQVESVDVASQQEKRLAEKVSLDDKEKDSQEPCNQQPTVSHANFLDAISEADQRSSERRDAKQLEEFDQEFQILGEANDSAYMRSDSVSAAVEGGGENANFLGCNFLRNSVVESVCGAQELISLDKAVPWKNASESCSQTATCIDNSVTEDAMETAFNSLEKVQTTKSELLIPWPMNITQQALSVLKTVSFPKRTILEPPRKFQASVLYYPEKANPTILISVKACPKSTLDLSLSPQLRSLSLSDEVEGSNIFLRAGTDGEILIKGGLGHFSFSFLMHHETYGFNSLKALQLLGTSGNRRLNSIKEALQILFPSQGRGQLLIRVFEKLMSSSYERLKSETPAWRFLRCISQYPETEEISSSEIDKYSETTHVDEQKAVTWQAPVQYTESDERCSKDTAITALDMVSEINSADEDKGGHRHDIVQTISFGDWSLLNSVDLEGHGIKRKHAGGEIEAYGYQESISQSRNSDGEQFSGPCLDNSFRIRWSFGDTEHNAPFYNRQRDIGANPKKFRRKASKLQPFKLHTEERGHIKDQHFVKQIEKMSAHEEKLHKHVAHKLPWTTDEPEVLRKPPVKLQTKPVEFQLMTSIRASERAKFDNYVAEKLCFLEQQRIHEEKLRQLAEEEEIKRMRKEMIPRAQLMPYFDRPFTPKRSSRPLTIPKEPRFHYMQKKRHKCTNWTDIW